MIITPIFSAIFAIFFVFLSIKVIKTRRNVIAHVVGSAGPDQATANFPPMRSRMACSAG